MEIAIGIGVLALGISIRNHFIIKRHKALLRRSEK